MNDPDRARRLCEELADEQVRDSCRYDLATVAKSKDDCAAIADNSYRDDCYDNLANQLNDPNLCAPITDNSAKDACYMLFIIEGNHDWCRYVTTEYGTSTCNALQG